MAIIHHIFYQNIHRSRKEENISRPGLPALEAQSLGGEKQIFISTEPVYMNNKLPRRGEIFFHCPGSGQ